MVENSSRKKRAALLPVVLFVLTFLLVQLFHLDYTIFALTLSALLTVLGLRYMVKNRSQIKLFDQAGSLLDLDEMTEQEFQQFLVPLFQYQGYSVTRPIKNEKRTADLILRKRGVKAVVHAKRQNGPLDKQAILDVMSLKQKYKATRLVIVTNRSFSLAAVKLARANKINLIDRTSLEAMYDAYLSHKQRHRFIQRVRTLFFREEAGQ
ncbi:restriction endonuclease [Alkalihalobacillus oceani]|uniref:restriction endonuclease n=1 Tax=Halalkalibacter oceani TaxID=1653776 RepID=UPI0020422854|nr:restriction endonuclease [Halalkalibacter oceani]MCM3759546.1 restriction endonuclease [Halalkalibacter oceani]